MLKGAIIEHHAPGEILSKGLVYGDESFFGKKPVLVKYFGLSKSIPSSYVYKAAIKEGELIIGETSSYDGVYRVSFSWYDLPTHSLVIFDSTIRDPKTKCSSYKPLDTINPVTFHLKKTYNEILSLHFHRSNDKQVIDEHNVANDPGKVVDLLKYMRNINKLSK